MCAHAMPSGARVIGDYTQGRYSEQELHDKRVGRLAAVLRQPAAAGEPRVGCITVLWRDDPTGWRGHVGFYLQHDRTHVQLLGGNQLDAVREHRYPLDTVLGHRWPAG
jgi:hypothetical protein